MHCIVVQCIVQYRELVYHAHTPHLRSRTHPHKQTNQRLGPYIYDEYDTDDSNDNTNNKNNNKTTTINIF